MTVDRDGNIWASCPRHTNTVQVVDANARPDPAKELKLMENYTLSEMTIEVAWRGKTTLDSQECCGITLW